MLDLRLGQRVALKINIIQDIENLPITVDNLNSGIYINCVAILTQTPTNYKDIKLQDRTVHRQRCRKALFVDKQETCIAFIVVEGNIRAFTQSKLNIYLTK